METPRNPFKAALLERRKQIGLWFCLADPTCAEICAGAGFDWMMIDSEHSPNDVRAIQTQLQAVLAYPTHPVVRPPVGDAIIIKQLLDVGAQTLLIPMVETVEQAKMLVQAMRYPPAGIRGLGGARAARWGRVGQYLAEADREVCLLVQIETRTGLENLEAIAAVEGIDGMFVGPADLSASVGHLGNWKHPEATAAIEGAIQRIVAAGKPAGILALEESAAHRFLELGCTFVAVGVDTYLLAHATESLAKRFKEKY